MNGDLGAPEVKQPPGAGPEFLVRAITPKNKRRGVRSWTVHNEMRVSWVG